MVVHGSACWRSVLVGALLAQSGCMLFGYERWSTGEGGVDGATGSRADGGDTMDAARQSDGATNGMDGAVDAGSGLPDANDAETPLDLDGGLEIVPDGSFDRDAAVGETCPPGEDCAPTCSSGEGQCLIDCTDSETCEATCAEKTRCEVECLGTNNCDFTCAAGARCGLDCAPSASASTNNCSATCAPGAHCGVSCVGVNNCEVSCEERSQCAVDCSGASDCDSVECAAGAKCLLYCPGGDCAWASCDAGGASCPDGTLTCGVKCLNDNEWSWENFSTYWGSPP